MSLQVFRRAFNPEHAGVTDPSGAPSLTADVTGTPGPGEVACQYSKGQPHSEPNHPASLACYHEIYSQ